MKKYFLLLLVFAGNAVFAQDKLLTMEDALVNNKTTLAPASLKHLQFIYGSNDYVYQQTIPGGTQWMTGNASTATERVLLTLDQLNDRLKTAGYAPAAAMPDIRFNISAEWSMTVNGDKLAMDPITGKVRLVIPKTIGEKDHVEESAAGYIAYVDNYNLYVSDGKGEANKLTSDGSNDIVYGASVHREEFGISKGTFWNNSGKSLAFYRMDQSMVADYPIIDWTTKPAQNKNIKYPMAGGKSHQVTVGVYNTVTRQVVYLKTGLPADQYLTNIAWSLDDRYVFIAVLNREQNHMWLNAYDAATGNLAKTLFEERDDKYVEPLVPVLFVKNKPGQFIWQSNRDGWNHLYLYDTSGTMLKQLTKGEWEVLDVKGFDAKGENLFYTSTAASPISRNLYLLNLKSGASDLVTEGISVHAEQVSTDGTTVLDNFSSAENPGTTELRNVKTGKVKLLLQSPNPLAGYVTGNMSIFTLDNLFGNRLYCRLYKPANFDATKKYPVIVYWYGGPHAQLVLNSWNGGASDYWFQYMAERGYVVFSMDTRGSDNRGKAFEQSMFRKVGEVQMQDMVQGLAYLRSQSFVDKARMGLFGWSFGGFMTTDFMLNYPAYFKAAVAGGPVMNWQYYEVMYTERYMDTPQENPDGYAATDLTRQVEKLTGKLLLIHGLQDPVVVQQNSVNFVRACIDKNIQVDYMIYPGHEHNVTGKDRAHLFQKITDYFMENLK